VFAVLRNPRLFKDMVKQNLALTILSLLVMVSVIWSDVPMITMRRSILFVFIIFSTAVAITYLKTPVQMFAVLYRVAFIALFLNVISLLLGMGFDLEGYFAGVHGHKNSLGPIAVIAIYTGCTVRHLPVLIINRFVNNLYLMCWCFLLLISVSKTSIALLLICPLTVHMLFKLSQRIKMSTGSLLLMLLVVFGFLFALVLAFTGLAVQEFLGLFMADPSFTGRDVIWIFMWEQIQEKLLLGYGYGGFWGVGFNSPNIQYGEGFITLLNQAHNGYLDLIAKLGIVGFGVYLFVLKSFSTNVAYIRAQLPVVAFSTWTIILLTLLHNLTESSIARGYSLIWLLQIIIFFLIARFRLEQIYMDEKS